MVQERVRAVTAACMITSTCSSTGTSYQLCHTSNVLANERDAHHDLQLIELARELRRGDRRGPGRLSRCERDHCREDKHGVGGLQVINIHPATFINLHA
jgi:hypothetical protein